MARTTIRIHTFHQKKNAEPSVCYHTIMSQHHPYFHLTIYLANHLALLSFAPQAQVFRETEQVYFEKV